MNADPFDSLHPAVRHHIVNTLGWSSLRPTQRDAIKPILEGQHCILLAPTAGGKTEAAIFPLLSRLLSENWRDTSILYVCPIRALLNNLEPRLRHYSSLLGCNVGIWHGDIANSTKQRLLKSPPHLLLTTPESLEGMLISTDERRRNLLLGIRVVVVDEMHAFCGDDRGWHIRCLIKRISKLAARNLQIIGLTATVANPDQLIRWFTYSAPAAVIGSGQPGADAEVSLDYVGSIENAALVISRLHSGEKRLVFCDSRSKVEELAALLRNLGVMTFVSHSSLSADERRQAEKAFSEESCCVIVATSTLELGIDVGDLDRVIQIDAPATVASFLQRMGRTGRRSGTIRNCLFLATNAEGFLLAAAIVRLWRALYVESIIPPPEPLHIVAQQALALALHWQGASRAQLHGSLCELFPEVEPDLIGRIINHMIETDIFWESQGVIALGTEGEAEFGRRNFETVVSTFTSPLLMTVLYGQKELGCVDPMSIRSKNDSPSVLILGGRYWRVVAQDWDSRMVWVEPSDDKGKAAWFGSSKTLGFDLCREILSILIDQVIPATLSKRAKQKIVELAAEFSFLREDRAILASEGSEWRWWSFAGWATNLVLADTCRNAGNPVKGFDNFSIRLTSPLSLLESDAFRFMVETDPDTEMKLMALAQSLKYQACLTPGMHIRIMKARLGNLEGSRAMLKLLAQNRPLSTHC